MSEIFSYYMINSQDFFFQDQSLELFNPKTSQKDFVIITTPFKNNNQIDRISLVINYLNQLELSLNNNPFESLPEISALKKLKELSLYDSNIDNLPESLFSLPSFRTLDVYKAKILPENEVILKLKGRGLNIAIKKIQIMIFYLKVFCQLQ